MACNMCIGFLWVLVRSMLVHKVVGLAPSVVSFPGADDTLIKGLAVADSIDSMTNNLDIF